MSTPKASPGEAIDVRPLGDRIEQSTTHVLVKTDAMEVIRLVLPAGKEIPEHAAPSEMTVHCLEGRVVFSCLGRSTMLGAGEMLYLSAKEPHALTAAEDSTLLVTLLLG